MKLFSIILTAAALALSVNAQDSGPTFGGPFDSKNAVALNAVPPLSTNTVILVSYTNTPFQTNVFSSPGALLSPNTNLLEWYVGDFNSAGVTFGFLGTATSTNDFQLFPSYDGGATFSPIPIFSFSNLAPGAATWFTNFASTNLLGVTHLAARWANRGTTMATNVLFELDFKANKIQTRQATY